MNSEEVIIGLILNAGNAKCHMHTALDYAKKGEFDLSKKEIERAGDAINEAHTIQTKILNAEAKGESFEVGALFVHAQDHLMTAMTEMALMHEIIELRKELYEKED